MSDDERYQRLISRSLSNAKDIRADVVELNHEGFRTVKLGASVIPNIDRVIDSLEAEMSRRALAKLESFKTQPELSL